MADELAGAFNGLYDDAFNPKSAALTYPGASYYRQQAVHLDSFLHGRGNRLFAPTEQGKGLLPIADMGCLGYVCIVTAGLERDKVVKWHEEHGVWGTDQTFKQYFDHWLDTELQVHEPSLPAPPKG